MAASDRTARPKAAFVYMVRCTGGQLYTGWTNDPAARLRAHRSGRGARYTRAHGAEGFAYLERCACLLYTSPPKGEPLAEPKGLAVLPRPLPLGEVDASFASGRRGRGRFYRGKKNRNTMKNFIFISPNFPTNYWQFCRELKNDGMNVLGIGDQPYDELKPELKDSLNEYYKVGSLENYDEVYRAVAFLTFKHGRIDWLESNNEYLSLIHI